MKYLRHCSLLIVFLLMTAGIANAVPGGEVWTRVRSKNFLLVGNASEKDIRKVGTRLEQFRETFRLLFSKMDLAGSIPTNVVVFKSDAAFKNFKPKRQDGKIDNFIAGFFQPGEDANYISLSAESGNDSRLNVIFHEYVHFIINTNFGKSKVPAWFNEGLAEYYETFAIEKDQTIKLGLPQSNHLAALQDSTPMPLRTLFGISNPQLLEMPDRPRALFYAESWALIHYLTQTGKSDQLNKFFQSLIRDVPPEKAFQDAFQTTYDQMEAELRRYVGRSQFNYNELTLKSKLVFDNEMQASVIGEAESNAYLGDLLYHMNRANDAEPFLLKALAADPASGLANTTLGMVKLRQEKFDEARKLLETAISTDGKNHLAYYRYAYLLSLPGSGNVRSSFAPEQAAKMRQALSKAIELNPSFTESYDLLAYVDVVTGEHLDNALDLMQKALRYQPGNQRYALRMADIYAVQNKFTEAEAIARKIAQTSDDPATRSRAEFMVDQIGRAKKVFAENDAESKADSDERVALRRRNESEAAAAEDPYAVARQINQALRKPLVSEKRVIGIIQRIDCKKRPLSFVVKTPKETFTLDSVDFESLQLGAFAAGSDQLQVGCDADLSAINAVITFTPTTGSKDGSRGDLTSIEFVPNDFQFLDQLPPSPDLLRKIKRDPNAATGPLMEPPPARNTEEQAARTRMMHQSIRELLPKPKGEEKQGIGYVDKVECSEAGAYLILRTANGSLRLLNSSPASLRIAIFSPELAGMKFGCSIQPIEAPAVFTYIEHRDATAKKDGDLITLSFVPKGFTIEP